MRACVRPCTNGGLRPPRGSAPPPHHKVQAARRRRTFSSGWGEETDEEGRLLSFPKSGNGNWKAGRAYSYKKLCLKRHGFISFQSRKATSSLEHSCWILFSGAGATKLSLLHHLSLSLSNHCLTIGTQLLR
ncbi:hypothetical protein MUK42_33642 [Musa troglodytarum]|uniref:Uncharacterized protein n=1 Tax=Musa troglodytarum TaxID=320322 RepID=A0A9E7IHI2_9LILI|nr:hypothetical protein MUK42_33642 [Musa troglodytarum]